MATIFQGDFLMFIKSYKFAKGGLNSGRYTKGSRDNNKPKPQTESLGGATSLIGAESLGSSPNDTKEIKGKKQANYFRQIEKVMTNGNEKEKLEAKKSLQNYAQLAKKSFTGKELAELLNKIADLCNK